MGSIYPLAQVTQGPLLLTAALVMWYIATRAAVDALAPAAVGSAGRRGLGYWIPAAVTVLSATLIGRADLAVGVIFGTSVAALSLVLGVASLSDRQRQLPPPRDVRAPWSLVTPLGVILLLSGFSGYFGWLSAGALIVFGMVALYVCVEREDFFLGSRSAGPGVGGDAGDADLTDPRLRALKMVQVPLALGVAGLGAWAGLEAADALARTQQVFSGTFVGSAMLAPALVLPIVGHAADLAHRGEHHRGVSSLVLMVLMNLCLLLPVVIVFTMLTGTQTLALEAAVDPPVFAPALATLQALRDADPLPYPLPTWRIDTIFLIILGIALIPLAAGRWFIGRGEALGLVLAYAAYLGLLARHAVR